MASSPICNKLPAGFLIKLLDRVPKIIDAVLKVKKCGRNK